MLLLFLFYYFRLMGVIIRNIVGDVLDGKENVVKYELVGIYKFI